MCCVNGCFSCLIKKHSDGYYTGKYFEPTCQSYGYTLYFCDHCGENYVENDVEDIIDPSKVNHSWIQDDIFGGDKVFTEVAVSYHNDGVTYTECELCGYQAKTIIPQWKGFSFVIDAADDDITAGSELKITVSIDANKVLLNAYSFDFSYNPEDLEFIKADFSNSAFNVNNFYTAPENSVEVIDMSDLGWGEIVIGSITVTGAYERAEGNKVQDMLIDSEIVLVDLYFKVINPETSYTSGNITDSTLLDMNGDDVIASIEEEMYAAADAAETFEELVAVYNMYVVEIWTGWDADIAMYLDANKNGEFDLGDCQIAFEIFTGAVEYTSVVDIDKDGEITLNDLQMLFDYYVGNLEIEDLLG